jgi:hypothetical protein
MRLGMVRVFSAMGVSLGESSDRRRTYPGWIGGGSCERHST